MVTGGDGFGRAKGHVQRGKERHTQYRYLQSVQVLLSNGPQHVIPMVHEVDLQEVRQQEIQKYV